MDALYREYIIDHYKNPRNFGELEGDRVADLRFHGQGCAISQATASIISEELKGKTVPEIARLDRHFVVDEIGIELSPTRLKCGLLGLKVAQGALLGTEDWPDGTDEAVDVSPEEAARLRSEI